MANTDKGEFVLLDTDLSTRLSILPSAQGHFYAELNEPGSGEVRIPLDSVAAGLVTSGQFVEYFYRGSSRGGFFVDNIKESQADTNEEGGRWLTLSGRGAMALLDRDIVWHDGTASGVRDFAAVTKAAILITLIDEIQALGGLANLTYDFTASVDSDSVAWTDSETYKLSVGTSLLDILRLFYKTGIDFDITLSGGSFILSAYKNGKGSDLSETIYFRTGMNCEEVSSDERGDDIANVLLTEYKDGYVVAEDAPSIAARGRRAKFLSAKFAQTSSSALTYAAAKVDLSKDPKKSIAVKVYDGVNPRLFLDYDIGDTVVLDMLGTEIDYRILGIQVDYDGDIFSNVVLEMNSLLYENDIRMSEDIDNLYNLLNLATDNDLIEVSFYSALGSAPLSTSLVLYSMVELGDYIYFGGSSGDPIDLGDGTTTLNIVKYHKKTGVWSAVGGGRPNTIGALATDGTDIYAGDYGISPGDVWKYDVSSDTWSSLGTFTTNYGGAKGVKKLLFNGADLYVGFAGMMDDWGTTVATIDGVDIRNNVGKLSGGVWTSLGTVHGSNYACEDLLFWGGDLYGTFSGPVALYGGFCKWVNSPPIEWDTFEVPDFGVFPNGRSGYSLADAGDAIVIGLGSYVTQSPQNAVVGLWSGGDTWTLIATLTGAVNPAPYALEVNLNDIYIGGNFTIADGVTGHNYITRYSAGTLLTQGDGLNNVVEDLLYSDGNLYLAGWFTLAGNQVAAGAADYITDFQTALEFLDKDDQRFNLGAAIHAAITAALTDNDEFPFWEDTAQGLRKVAWTNIKATLKTYFDTLYGTGVHLTSILLLSGTTITTYATSDAGLDSAIAAAVTGDTIFLPKCTLTAVHTISASKSLTFIGVKGDTVWGADTAPTQISNQIIINGSGATERTLKFYNIGFHFTAAANSKGTIEINTTTNDLNLYFFNCDLIHDGASTYNGDIFRVPSGVNKSIYLYLLHCTINPMNWVTLVSRYVNEIDTNGYIYGDFFECRFERTGRFVTDAQEFSLYGCTLPYSYHQDAALLANLRSYCYLDSWQSDGFFIDAVNELTHASDIAEGVLRRHLPAPGADGKIAVSDSGEWILGDAGGNSFQIDQSGGTSDTYGVLAGTINGTNKVFTVSLGAYVSGSLKIYLNGQLQTQGSGQDWVETTPASGTFTFDVAPISGDEITVTYQFATVATGNADTLDGLHASAFVLSSTPAREVLTANRTYYVRTDGSDSNNGLTDSAGGAFLTIQKAIDVVATLDLSTYAVTIQVGNGTYTGANTLKTFVGVGPVTIQGSATPSNVLISTTSANCFTAAGVVGYIIKDMELRTTTSGNCLSASVQGFIKFTNVQFGACAGYHVDSQTGAIIQATGNYLVSGNAVGHLVAYVNSIINTGGMTITYSNSPAFSNWNFYFESGAMLYVWGMTFTNGATVTGKRYSGLINGMCNTNGGGANYVPGNSAGTTASGAQYF